MAEQIGIFPTPLVAPFLAAYSAVRSLCLRPSQTLQLTSFFTACPAASRFFDPFSQAHS